MLSLISLFSNQTKHYNNVRLAYDVYDLIFATEIARTKKVLDAAIREIIFDSSTHYGSVEYELVRSFLGTLMNILRLTTNKYEQVEQVTLVFLCANIEYDHQVYLSRVATKLVFIATDNNRQSLSYGMINIYSIVDNIEKYKGVLYLEKDVVDAAGQLDESYIPRPVLNGLFSAILDLESDDAIFAARLGDPILDVLPITIKTKIVGPLNAAKLPRLTFALILITVVLKIIRKKFDETLKILRGRALALLEANAIFSDKIVHENIDNLVSGIISDTGK